MVPGAHGPVYRSTRPGTRKVVGYPISSTADTADSVLVMTCPTAPNARNASPPAVRAALAQLVYAVR